MESAKQLQPFADEAKRFRALRSPGHCKLRGFRNAAIGLPRLGPTLRAFEQALDIATSAGDRNATSELYAQAKERWGKSTAFLSSPIAGRCSKLGEGATA
jgi:hypothetical protein